MKNQINEIYTMPMCSALKHHLLNDMGFSETDRRILESLISFEGDSNFHYDRTGLPKEKFERHLRSINLIVFSELLRLSNLQMTEQ